MGSEMCIRDSFLQAGFQFVENSDDIPPERILDPCCAGGKAMHFLQNQLPACHGTKNDATTFSAKVTGGIVTTAHSFIRVFVSALTGSAENRVYKRCSYRYLKFQRFLSVVLVDSIGDSVDVFVAHEDWPAQSRRADKDLGRFMRHQRGCLHGARRFA